MGTAVDVGATQAMEPGHEYDPPYDHGLDPCGAACGSAHATPKMGHVGDFASASDQSCSHVDHDRSSGQAEAGHEDSSRGWWRQKWAIVQLAVEDEVVSEGHVQLAVVVEVVCEGQGQPHGPSHSSPPPPALPPALHQSNHRASSEGATNAVHPPVVE